MEKNIIKKYYVLEIYDYATPDVVAQFDQHADATTYAALASKSDKEHRYIVTQCISTALDAVTTEQGA